MHCRVLTYGILLAHYRHFIAKPFGLQNGEKNGKKARENDWGDDMVTYSSLEGVLSTWTFSLITYASSCILYTVDRQASGLVYFQIISSLLCIKIIFFEIM